MANSTPYPVNFRDEEMRVVFDHIIDGDSLAIIGVGTVGKTLLVNHFSTRADVQDRYLKAAAVPFRGADLLFLPIDPNAMLDTSPRAGEVGSALPAAWPGFELIFRRLVEAAVLREGAGHATAGLAARLERLYLDSADPAHLGPQRAFQLVEQAVSILLQDLTPPAERLILLFDEFETLAGSMPASFFLNLRALRDRFRQQVVYVVLARQDPAAIFPVEQQLAVEPFTELFRQPLYLGPFSRAKDLDPVLASLVARKMPSGWRWPEGAQEGLRQVTGGHAGLVRTCFEYVEVHAALFEASAGRAANGRHVDAGLLRALLAEGPVVRECAIIAESLSPSEQQALLILAQDGSVLPVSLEQAAAYQSLRARRLVEQRGGTWRLTIPLLEAYLSNRE